MKMHRITSGRERGVTLIELMVGLSIGLMVVAVGMGALMVSRGLSGSVSDTTGMQQQGAYVLRVIGQQLRQAGSLYLNPDPNGATGTDVLGAVVFEIKADTADDENYSFEQKDTISGGNATLTTGFRRYLDNVFVADNASATAIGTEYLARNCLGGPAFTKKHERVESTFTLVDGDLRCGGNGVATQPIAQNVAQFQLNYMVQTTGAGGSTVQYTKGSDMPAAATDPLWRRVQGVQVCMVLFGTETIDMPAGSSYTDCNGDSVNMTTLTGVRKNRAHLLFRGTFQLRSQGLLGSDV